MNTIEYALRDRIGYAWAIASFEIATILILATLLVLGSEARGKLFVEEPEAVPGG